MLLILVSLYGLITCVSQHKHLLVHLSCNSITKTKQGHFRRQEAHGLTDPQIAEQREKSGRQGGRTRREKQEGEETGEEEEEEREGAQLLSRRERGRASSAPGARRQDGAVSGIGSDGTGRAQQRAGRTGAACALFQWGPLFRRGEARESKADPSARSWKGPASAAAAHPAAALFPRHRQSGSTVRHPHRSEAG